MQRHRIKRIYKEAFRSLQEKIKPGYDLVLVARKPAVDTGYWQARRSCGLFAKSKLSFDYLQLTSGKAVKNIILALLRFYQVLISR